MQSPLCHHLRCLGLFTSAVMMVRFQVTESSCLCGPVWFSWNLGQVFIIQILTWESRGTGVVGDVPEATRPIHSEARTRAQYSSCPIAFVLDPLAPWRRPGTCMAPCWHAISRSYWHWSLQRLRKSKISFWSMHSECLIIFILTQFFEHRQSQCIVDYFCPYWCIRATVQVYNLLSN